MPRRSAKRSRSAAPVTLVSRTALCVLAGISEDELTVWEHEEFFVASNHAQSEDGEPLYDASALRRARLIRTLGEELQVNLAGIGVILHLLDQMGG